MEDVQPTNGRNSLGDSRPEVSFEDFLESNETYNSDDEREESVLYSWEKGYEKSWELLREKDGVLELDKLHSSTGIRKYSARVDQKVRRGLIRNLIILLDFSESMREIDYKPDRLNCAVNILQEFIKEYFVSNAISQLGMITMAKGQATVVTSLAANPDEQIKNLNDAKSAGCAGAPSLQNALERATGILCCMPPYGTREVLIVFGSLKSCDSGSIDATIAKLKDNGIRVSVVSMTPELYVLKNISSCSGGTFAVAMDKIHFKDLIFAHVTPPIWGDKMEARLVPMGFPPLVKKNTLSLCMCHNRASPKGYICTNCHSKMCESPSRCRVCGLHLASYADIARTHHHLFPPSNFIPLPRYEGSCCMCCRPFTTGGGQCPECKCVYCYDCDIYAHDKLHHCPMCILSDEISVRGKKGLT